MKIGAIPGLNITINIGTVEPEVAVTKKPKIPPELIEKRMANLRKGQEKKKFNRDIYPKVVSHDNTPETPGLDPKPRKGYYH